MKIRIDGTHLRSGWAPGAGAHLELKAKGGVCKILIDADLLQSLCLEYKKEPLEISNLLAGVTQILLK